MSDIAIKERPPEMTNDTSIERRKRPLCSCIDSALQRFFTDLDGHQPPQDIYQMVLSEIELPLFKSVMTYTRGNQSKAAEVLGINRSTLRKKLEKYGLQD
jgi:Fis family transcriptional regulator